ncbi:hypothetical protein KUTeg_001741 [Tegillarca granosa]|uniref:RING-type E3 ubiquitin transferase n=1 Tax=Tegillarca granosa TaxID=220873 RepID=A0ABQ9FSB7_TEGGR|nr:hypothetical protein KUTeg_001741 [Tegillarca granosa]
MHINRMFIGTRVVRGPDWSSMEQDGGEGHLGTIVDQSESDDKTVTVIWDTGRERIYKAKDNSFELRLFDNAQAVHLTLLPSTSLRFTPLYSFPLYFSSHYFISLHFTSLHSTYRYQIYDRKFYIRFTILLVSNFPQEKVRRIRFAKQKCLSEIGTVVQIIVPGLVRVQYQNGNMYSLNQLSLSKVHTFQKGDLVRVFGDKEMVSALQQGHGGWSDNYNQTLGKLGRVVDVDEDGDVLVVIDKIQNVFSPVCLDSVDEGTVESSQKVPPVPENLHTKRLFEPDRSNQETTRPRKSLISLVVGGDLALVEDFVKENPKAIDVEENGVTALQVACQKGHENIVKCLIKANANIDKTDKEGNTPLHICVENHKARVAKMLIENKAKLDVKNQNGMTPLHLAVSENRPVCSPSGGTAVHDAISNEENHAVTEILKAKTIKFETENSDGFDMLQWACIKKCTIVIILGANVNCQDKDGNTPLHGTQILQTSPGFSDMDNDWASIACVLIEHGANLKVLNKENKSPLDIAPTVSKMYLQRLWKTAQQRQQEKKGAGGGLYLPLQWKDMTGIPLLFVSLNKTDPIEKLEYKHVEETLLKGLPKREVKEIIRVQNKYLWELYSM